MEKTEKIPPFRVVFLFDDDYSSSSSLLLSIKPAARAATPIMQKPIPLAPPVFAEEAERIGTFHKERQAEFDEAAAIGKKLGVYMRN